MENTNIELPYIEIIFTDFTGYIIKEDIIINKDDIDNFEINDIEQIELLKNENSSEFKGFKFLFCKEKVIDDGIIHHCKQFTNKFLCQFIASNGIIQNSTIIETQAYDPVKTQRNSLKFNCNLVCSANVRLCISRPKAYYKNIFNELPRTINNEAIQTFCNILSIEDYFVRYSFLYDFLQKILPGPSNQNTVFAHIKNKYPEIKCDYPIPNSVKIKYSINRNFNDELTEFRNKIAHNYSEYETMKNKVEENLKTLTKIINDVIFEK